MSEPAERVEPEFRLATAEDAPEILRVMEAAFERWPSPEISVPAVEHLRWKMALAPGVPATHAVGLLDGRIVAAVLRWGAPVKVGALQGLANGGADLAIDPDYQGRRIGKPLADHGLSLAKQHSQIGFGTPSTNARVPRIYAHGNYVTEPHLLAGWERAFNVRALAGLHLQPGVVRNPARRIRQVSRAYMRRRASLPDGVRIEEISRFDERADRLWEAAEPGFDFSVVRSAAFLNWRYAEPAAGDATILAAIEGDEMLGYAVFKRRDDWGQVVDVLVHPDRVNVLTHVLEEASRRLRDAGCDGAVCWLPPGHPYERTLVAARYLDTLSRTTLSMWDLGESGALKELEGKYRFHCTLGDFDWV